MQNFLSTNNTLKRAFEKAYVCDTITVIEPLEKKHDIGAGSVRKCRFCNGARPNVKFSHQSHALPMMMGNRSIVDSLECDNCNKVFGIKLEDSFAKYLLPNRTFCRIKGRTGFVTYKDERQRISAESIERVRVTLTDNISIKKSIIDNTSVLEFTLVRQPYSPIAIYKTLIKIAISFMSKRDHQKFPRLKEWLLEEEHVKRNGISSDVLEWELSGPANPDKFSIMLAKARVKYRKTHCRYMLVLRFSNFQYQIPIMDQRMCVKLKPLKFIFAPILLGDEYISEHGDSFTPQFKKWNSSEIIRGEEVEIKMAYK